MRLDGHVCESYFNFILLVKFFLQALCLPTLLGTILDEHANRDRDRVDVPEDVKFTNLLLILKSKNVNGHVNLLI